MKTKVLLSILLGALLTMTATQANAQLKKGTVHGRVINGAGLPFDGTVKLTTDPHPADPATAKYKFEIPVDASGNFKSDQIDSGTYLGVFFHGEKMLDFQSDIKVVIGADTEVVFDMTRKEWLDKLTPEEKQALEEYKKSVAAASAENAKIGNLNNMLQQAREAMKAKDYDKAADMMQQAVAQKPEEGLLQYELGNALYGQKKYADAAAAFQKAVTLNDASKKPNASLDAVADNNLGQALASSGKAADAAAAYEAAAKLDAANAGMYYANEAATFYNVYSAKGDMAAADAAVAAAQKGVAIDPTGRPILYFIIGQGLIPKVSTDSKGMYVFPAGCLEAYHKYMELDPNGVHVKEIQDILTGMGQPIPQISTGKKKGR